MTRRITYFRCKSYLQILQKNARQQKKIYLELQKNTERA